MVADAGEGWRGVDTQMISPGLYGLCRVGASVHLFHNFLTATDISRGLTCSGCRLGPINKVRGNMFSCLVAT